MASLSLRPQAARSLFNLAGVVLAGLALAGCVPRGRPPIEQPTVIERPAERASRLPAGETMNRVAVLAPLTGPTGNVGQALLNAVQLAMADMSEARVRITPYDTAGGANEAAARAIAEGNGLILGPLLAEDVRAIAPMARAADVPVIAFSNDISVAGDGVYLMGLNPAQSIDRVVRHARAQGATRFGALAPQGLYGERAAAALRASVEASGGQLNGVQSYDRSAGAARAAATRLMAAGPFDAVLIADGSRVAAQVAPLLRPRGSTLRLLGTELWAGESNIGANAALRGAWFAAPSDALFDQFRTRYRARYSSAPQRIATLGYDAALLTQRVASDWRLGRDFPAGELRNTGGFAGVDGAFRFGRSGVAERALEVREVTASGTAVVSAAPRGFE
jgi:branched-chain amino acid transport system substrate-binding protein